jgi:hypothetical protein
MPVLTLEVSHTLGQETAAQRLKDCFQAVMEKYGEHVSEFEEAWNGDRLTFRFKTFGMKVQGKITPGPQDVKVRAELPLAALPFKRMIETQIREELSRTLA